MSIIWINIYNNDNNHFIDIISIILISISVFYIIFFIFTFIGYFIYYQNFKKLKQNKNKSSLNINEEGIIDTTDEITISSKWEQLTYVLIAEYYIVITTTTNIMYLFPIDIKNKLITGINKYNTYKELKIIEKQN